MSVRFIVMAALLAGGLSVSGARAQHVVTDAEAGKLTLDALTATPRPAYRPLYRAALHRAPVYREPAYRDMVRPVASFRRAHRPGYVSRQMHATQRATRLKRIRRR